MQTPQPLNLPPLVIPPAQPAAPAQDPNDPQVILRNLFSGYADGNQQQYNGAFLHLMQTINNLNVLGINDAERQFLGRIVSSALSVFIQPDFEIMEQVAFPVLMYNALIGNIMAGCLRSNTDQHIIMVRGQKQEIYKTMVLYSARNELEVDVANLMLLNPELASKWLYQTWKTVFSGNCNEKVTRNLARFLAQMDHRVLPAFDIQELYFGCTYLGIPEERRAKELINQSIQRHIQVPIHNTPNPRKIAVFSDYWFKGHSVHRTLGQYIEALKDDFDLTLMHSIRPADQLDTSMFKDVRQVNFDGARLDATPFELNDFAAVIYPDIGMSLTSILMSNLRIAPVQMIMTGHPASTFGGKIDYFISGQEVDLPIIAPQNYSERLVLLPGYGAVHEPPTYQLKGRVKQGTEILINCSWYGQKIHWRCLETVNNALKQCKNRAKLRVFAGNAPILHKGYAAFLNDLSRQLSNSWVEAVPHVAYEEYMALMEEGDFAIDVFPFAGSNTVSDNLHLRKPTLVREGYRWFNRIGPAMLRSAGLDELISTTDDDYMKKLIRLVDEPEYRASFADRLRQVNLPSTVHNPKGAKQFAEFIKNVTRDPGHYKG
ncbi:MAG: hypothetical protein ACKO85_06520, partial [Isosphaeraceae bacterium]